MNKSRVSRTIYIQFGSAADYTPKLEDDAGYLQSETTRYTSRPRAHDILMLLGQLLET